MSKWIRFVDNTPKDRKTNIWDVVAIAGGSVLGEVKWYGPWRRYSFFPYACTIWEKTCLLDIIDFIDEQMAERKKKV